jgi:inorganic pyrophosphatase
MYGVSLAAVGILSTLVSSLTIDAYGPISDNAGGIAEMANLGPRARNRCASQPAAHPRPAGEETRKVTDALDSAGNTTAAIGKGFAIGSAAFVRRVAAPQAAARLT